MSELSSRTVVVTGAGGFVGRQVLQPLLDRGYAVHAITRSDAIPAAADVVSHRIDLFDYDDVRAVLTGIRPSHLLHLAWDVPPGTFWNSMENFRWVEASMRLLEAFRDAGGRRAVMAGTCAEYDWTEDCCNAATPVRPATVYGVCKNALRELITAYGAANSLSTAWGRIFYLFGPFEHPSRLVPSVIAGIARRRLVECTDGLQQRDFLHVRDVASAFAALLDCDVTGPVDIGSGIATPVRDVIERIARRMDGSSYVRLGARSRPRAEPLIIRADPERLNREVGWTPELPWQDALDETVDWWQRALGASA